MKNNINIEKCQRLRNAKDFADLDTLKIMYNAFVMPHFIYCSTVWQNNNQAHLDQLYKLQKRAARIITNSDYYAKPLQPRVRMITN